MTSSMASQTDVRRHVISNIVFANASEEAAQVVSNLTLLATDSGVLSLLSAGIYRDEVALLQGEWQIVNRHLDLDKSY